MVTVTGPEPKAEPNQQHIHFPSAEVMVATLGAQDMLLRVLHGVYGDIDIKVKGQELIITGSQSVVGEINDIIAELRSVAESGTVVSPNIIEATISGIRQVTPQPHGAIISPVGKKIRPKTANQQRYVEAIDNNTVIFGLGPAGTGKTYLAMAKAVQALQSREVNRIILTRPAVEAGESLGYLPGTLNEKIDPYLRPLYDALQEMVDAESIPHLMESGTIEVAPLAYMRGRTLNDAFIILDEAQNTSGEQMKMFLTRLGFNSHMVITGDTSQVDLPRGKTSGLAQAADYLKSIDDIAIINLTSKDVIRHALVSAIVNAYDTHEAPRSQRKYR